MSWFKVDDTFAFHPKVVGAGNAAIGLWVRAGSWSAQQLTDGRIPRSMLAALGGRPADARKLVECGLWVTTRDGWAFHDWDSFQPSRKAVEDRREATANRVRKWRSEHSGDASRNGVTNGVTNAPPVPSRPVPSQTPLLTFVCRRLSEGARETTKDGEWESWVDLVGAADLNAELAAWLAYNADTDLKNAGASLRGWLRKAADRAASAQPGCTDCAAGWLGEDDAGRPVPCPTCRPNVIPMRGAS